MSFNCVQLDTSTFIKLNNYKQRIDLGGCWWVRTNQYLFHRFYICTRKLKKYICILTRELLTKLTDSLVVRKGL